MKGAPVSSALSALVLAHRYRWTEGQRAKQMENPTMRGPLETNANRYAALAEKLEAARKKR